jgi:hypothetical protein
MLLSDPSILPEWNAITKSLSIYLKHKCHCLFFTFMQNTDSSQNPNIHKCALLESHTTTIHAQRQVILQSQLQLTQILLESQPNLRTQIAQSNHNQNTDTLRWQGVRVSTLGQFKGQGKLRCDVTIVAQS